MKDSQEIDVCDGVKTFFVVPDLSLLPEEYLPTWFLNGFETYYLHDSTQLSIEAKVRAVLRRFPEVILFFNIDRKLPGVDWPSFIGRLSRDFRDRAIIGVMFQKRHNPEEVRNLERLYLYQLGISGGCIPLEFQKQRNLTLFTNVLRVNGANGRRKSLRAICTSSCKLNFTFCGKSVTAQIRDISISHFSCAAHGNVPDIPINEVIHGIQMNLRGILCNVDGVLCIRRQIGEESLMVFVYQAPGSREGLTMDLRIKINALVYAYFIEKTEALLQADFEAEKLRLRAEPVAAERSVSEPETVAKDASSGVGIPEA
jgi:hypothetical protein